MRTIVPSVRTLVLIILFTSSSLLSRAQSIITGNGAIEIGIGVGPLFFLGDLGGTQGVGKTFVKDVNFPLTKLSKGIYANIYPTDFLGLRIAANHGVLEGDDSQIDPKGGDEMARLNRNLKFKSSLLEAYGAIEVYPTIFLEQYDGLQGKLRPYGVIGIGMFKFNPKGEYIAPNGQKQWVELKPLKLEGQGMPEYSEKKEYSLMQMHIPMGFGAKYYIKENLYVGIEVLHRKTFTDYIDDVSTTYIDPNLFDVHLTPAQAQMAHQLHYRGNYVTPVTRPAIDEQRGDPKENDAFFSTILRCGFRLNDNNSPSGRAAKQLRCPSFY